MKDLPQYREDSDTVALLFCGFIGLHTKEIIFLRWLLVNIKN